MLRVLFSCAGQTALNTSGNETNRCKIKRLPVHSLTSRPRFGLLAVPLFTRPPLALAGAALLSAARGQAADSAEGTAFFGSKIRPALVEYCFKCHSAEAEKVKGDLRLDTREALRKGGESGAAIVEGKPDESLLIKAVRRLDKDLAMPPKKELPEAVINDFVAWVKMGAPALADAAPVAQIDYAAERKKWAFHKPVEPAVPVAADAAKWTNPIDRFLAAKFEGAHLSAAPPADKRTLLRRATFDLAGLPPTPEELAAFVADESPEAFAKVVERLLGCPQYGERWGRHWLDVARTPTRSTPAEPGKRATFSMRGGIAIGWSIRSIATGRSTNSSRTKSPATSSRRARACPRTLRSAAGAAPAGLPGRPRGGRAAGENRVNAILHRVPAELVRRAVDDPTFHPAARQPHCQLWDQHGSLRKELPTNCAAGDKPIAGLLQDLKVRGPRISFARDPAREFQPPAAFRG